MGINYRRLLPLLCVGMFFGCSTANAQLFDIVKDKVIKVLDPTDPTSPGGNLVDTIRGNTHVPVKFVNTTSKRIRIRGYHFKPIPNFGAQKRYFTVSIDPYQTKTVFNTYAQNFYFYAFQPDTKKRWEGGYPMKIRTGPNKYRTRSLIRVNLGSGWQRKGAKTIRLVNYRQSR